MCIRNKKSIKYPIKYWYIKIKCYLCQIKQGKEWDRIYKHIRLWIECGATLLHSAIIWLMKFLSIVIVLDLMVSIKRKKKKKKKKRLICLI